MRTITTVSGTVYRVAFCGASDGYLWITLSGFCGGIPAAAVAFDDPSDTAEIVHEWSGNDRETYTGYTRLVQVETVDEGVRVVLKKEG